METEKSLTVFSKKFKYIESQYETRLDPFKYTIIRLDGHKFHKYTKKYFSFPFDIRIPLALYEATRKLIIRTSGIILYSYIQSDEISLLTPPADIFTDYFGWQDIPNLYNYRIQKIVSLFSSFVTGEFNRSIIDISNNTDVRNYQNRLMSTFEFKRAKDTYDIPQESAYFDCRIFQLDTEDKVKEYFTWRRIDAIRNSKNQFSYGYLTHNETIHKSSNERIQIIRTRYNKVYYSLPIVIKSGLFVKTNGLINIANNFDFYEVESILPKADEYKLLLRYRSFDF